MKLFLAIVIVVIIIALGCERSLISSQTCQVLTLRFENFLHWVMGIFDGVSSVETCEDLVPQIIELSKEEEIKIISISNIRNAEVLKEIIRPDSDNRKIYCFVLPKVGLITIKTLMCIFI